MVIDVSMPSRAYTSFLRSIHSHWIPNFAKVSMPSRAYTSFLREVYKNELNKAFVCQCPLGLIPHFYEVKEFDSRVGHAILCQCPLGLIPHFYWKNGYTTMNFKFCVNALSGLYLISTVSDLVRMAHIITGVNALSGLYLISTRKSVIWHTRMEKLCQCPLGLIPHFYVPLQKPRFYAVSRACFCRYLSEYSDSSSFLCMLTIWTYLMRQIIHLTLI